MCASRKYRAKDKTTGKVLKEFDAPSKQEAEALFRVVRLINTGPHTPVEVRGEVEIEEAD